MTCVLIDKSLSMNTPSSLTDDTGLIETPVTSNGSSLIKCLWLGVEHEINSVFVGLRFSLLKDELTSFMHCSTLVFRLLLSLGLQLAYI